MTKSYIKKKLQGRGVPWSDCWRHWASGRLLQLWGASVTWKGEGNWTPKHFCFFLRVYLVRELIVCKPKPDAQLPLAKGETLPLDCDSEQYKYWQKCDDENCETRDNVGDLTGIDKRDDDEEICLDRKWKGSDKKCRDKHPLCGGLYTLHGKT